MAMRMTTVRLSEPLYRELQRMSELAGVSIAQWLREAAIAQLNFERGMEFGRQQALSDPNTDDATAASRPQPSSKCQAPTRGLGHALGLVSERRPGDLLRPGDLAGGVSS